ERGWNVYVGGNGGFTPRHAELLAEDLDDEMLVRVIDRFLAYYIRTADRLQRTAPWVADYPGGITELRKVLVEDSLGISADLEACEDEWAATLADPVRLARFASFVNAPDTPDPDLAYTPERGQVRPARAGEESNPNPVIARTIAVRPSDADAEVSR